MMLRQFEPPDYGQAREHFSERDLVDLTLAVVALNGWNRFCIAFRVVPGTYRPHRELGVPVA